jgi:hypothetical protein
MTRAALLLIVSIGLCSACTVGAKNISPPLVIVPVAQCPAPPRPALPDLDAALPLDSPANVEALMIRDDALRGYIQGLESCVECYRVQAE